MIPSTLRGACALLALSAPLAAQGEPTVADEIARLIEETNALESFHAVYDLAKTADGVEEQAVLEIVYRAPDVARLRMRRDEDVVDTWIVDGEFFLFTSAGERWRRAGVPELGPAGRALDEHFPVDVAAPLPPGVVFELRAGREKLDASIGHVPFDRHGLFGWLRELEVRSGELVRDGERLVLDGDGVRRVYSRATGFPELLELTRGEDWSRLRLRSVRVDEDLEPDLVTLPDAAGDAEEDADLARALRQEVGPLSVRAKACARAVHRMAQGERPWSDWRALSEAVHAEAMDAFFAAWVTSLETQFAQLPDQVRRRLAEENSPDARRAVEERLAAERAKLEASLAQAHDHYVGELPALAPLPASAADLADIEREVVDALWQERWAARLLAAYDEAVRSGLED